MTGPRDIPLKFAAELSAVVNAEWESGRFLDAVSPITADLLRYWFDPSFCDVRDRNFHPGQRQSILNTIYVHEVLKSKSVSDMYAAIGAFVATPFVDSEFMGITCADKYNLAKYCIKMATGTGKTWVLNALLVWQYLNAKYMPAGGDVKYTKNFLLVAPGLIVYERLLDAFRGKETALGVRNFDTSDLKSNEELFLPEKYRQDIYSFVQNAVADKTEIGHKTTGDGLIAITNWHALVDADDEDGDDDADDIQFGGVDLGATKSIARDILPIAPGTTAGNALDSLDSRFLNGGMLEYLSGLPDLCVFNDEAHHIHETKKYGVIQEVEWQKSLNFISNALQRNFIQIDFSATPYNATGSAKNRVKHYFPHIVANYELSTAMRAGFVKTFVLDQRKELASLANEDIDFKSVRNDSKKVIGLSDGQRLMLRAGLSRLKILEDDFVKHNSAKHPKMMVICEDTNVSPFVVQFLQSEGLAPDDIMQIDSNKKGELKTDDWNALKQRLFNLDKQAQPKVVVSVLMLREGFDVNNICVIVPLRSSQQPILLEQVLGRGLRLMWRGREYEELKAENRHNIYDLKQEPLNYLDTLFVVEHPAFKEFYEDLDKDIVVAETKERPRDASALGDMVSSSLKENCVEYDMFWPQIIREREETLSGATISVDNMQPLSGWNLAQLKQMVPHDNAERFVGTEMQVKTRFGEYKVRGDIFTAQSYNEYLQKMLNIITANFAKVASNGHRTEMPLMQIDHSLLISAIDQFIRTRLFDQPFDPLVDGNWRVLILANAKIIEHTMTELSKAIYDMHNNIDVREAIVEKRYFSEIPSLIGRENYALDVKKSIYDRTFYPSNKGGLERAFLLACDADSAVERIIKINENKHTFARFRYLRSDGMLGTYYPDFMVKIGDRVYVVETKGNNMAQNPDVKSKEVGAMDWVAKINELPPAQRMDAEWHYALLTDEQFYSLRDKNASIREILDFCRLTRGRATGALFE
ncbi:MAG: DEAD/DEAH box helicase family protein [Alphaproteobacteria bacterium]|nr:DEAD/DEAH box helicase family protein [Alphaproteobacteria bacterium]